MHVFQVAAGVVIVSFFLAIFMSLTQVLVIRSKNGVLRSQEKALDLARVKKSNLEDLSNQYKSMASYLARVNGMVERQLKQLNFQKESWGSWALTLLELKAHIPPKLWFYNLETKDDKFYVEGGAFSQDAITLLMSNMRGSPSFSNMQFDYTNKTTIGAADVIDFKINCKYDTKVVVQ